MSTEEAEAVRGKRGGGGVMEKGEKRVRRAVEEEEETCGIEAKRRANDSERDETLAKNLMQ